MQMIRNKMEGILSEAQAGFRVKRSTIDQIFTLRRLAEKYYVFGKHLYICYVDLKEVALGKLVGDCCNGIRPDAFLTPNNTVRLVAYEL